MSPLAGEIRMRMGCSNGNYTEDCGREGGREERKVKYNTCGFSQRVWSCIMTCAERDGMGGNIHHDAQVK